MAKILIADDDDLLLELLQFKLELRGHWILTAMDGAAALEIARTKKPNLIVLDGMMPVMDGFEALQNLKQNEQTADIPVVMLTARKQEADVVRALQLGVSDYLVKPFMPEELLTRIENNLRQRDAYSRRASA